MQDPFQHHTMVWLMCVFLSTATSTIAWHGFNHYESAVAPLQTGHSRCLTCCMNGSWFFQIDAIKAKKNPDLWMRFLKIYRKHQVDFQWVKGHNSHPQNERCDELAVMASQQEKLSIDEFYEREEGKLL